MTFTRETEKLAKALLLPINPAAVVILGLYTIVWGLWLISPWWSVFSHAPLYSALAHFWLANIFGLDPEIFWGAIAVTCGAVTTYGAWRRHYKPLVRGAITSSTHWLVIAIFYFWGDAVSTGGITALTFAIYAAFVYLNIRVNHKEDPRDPDILHPKR